MSYLGSVICTASSLVLELCFFPLDLPGFDLFELLPLLDPLSSAVLENRDLYLFIVLNFVDLFTKDCVSFGAIIGSNRFEVLCAILVFFFYGNS